MTSAFTSKLLPSVRWKMKKARCAEDVLGAYDADDYEQLHHPISRT